ncbi:MAG: c-type cytochrome [Thiovulaceae bacterium]|nr:c-type cytochrome [Sulfurimonadaceae bacterium]
MSIRTLALISFIVIVSSFTLSYFTSKKPKQSYSDDELRKVALSRNMSSIPKNYKDLLKLVDTDENRLTKNKIALGKELYFDPLLSKNKDISCSTCHLISKDTKSKTVYSELLTAKTNKKSDCIICHMSDQSGTDRQENAIGHQGLENPLHLNTLTTLNSSLAKYLTWDGSVESVENQSGASIKDKYKMAMNEAEVEQRLNNSNKYHKLFKQNFGEVKFEYVQKAIGAYLRTLTTRSAYDRFLEGDNNAMSASAKRGLSNFIDFGCKGCHTGITVGGQSIQKFPVRDYNSIMDVTNSFKDNGREIGSFGFNDGVYHTYPFENKGGFMGQDGRRLFRVPMLRNVTKTSPYFHNGSVMKIRDAVILMARHQLGMSLTSQQIDDIVEFLKSLEGDIVEYDIKDGEKNEK